MTPAEQAQVDAIARGLQLAPWKAIATLLVRLEELNTRLRELTDALHAPAPK